MQRIILKIFAACLLWPAAVIAQLTTSVDRNPLPPGVPVVLSVELEGSAAEPDFSVLEQEFQILNSRSGTNISVINGKARRIRNWELSLLPKANSSGKIPALVAGSHRSQPIQLDFSDDPAVAAQADQVAKIDMHLKHAKAPVHVGEQLLLDVRLRVQPGLANTRLTPPTVEGALMEPIGQAKESTELLQGIRYEVYEWRYAIFPERSGELRVQAPVFQAEQLSRSGSRNPFGGSLFGGQRTPVLATAPAQSLNIDPVPAGARGAFLPARHVSLSQQWLPEKTAFKLGEPATRVLELRVDGQLHSQLQAPQLQWPAQLRQYPEEPQGETLASSQGVQARLTSRWAVIPNQVGEFELPGTELQWWDVEADQWRTARLDPQILQAVSTVSAAGAGGEQSAASGPQSGISNTGTAGPATDARRWQWAFVLAMVGWILSLLVVAWLWHRRAPSAHAPLVSDVREAQLRKALLSTLRGNHSPAVARQQLQAWAGAYLRAQGRTAPASLESMIDAIGDAPLRAALAQLNAQLYSSGTAPSAADALRKALAELPPPQQSSRSSAHVGLPSLYPSGTVRTA